MGDLQATRKKGSPQRLYAARLRWRRHSPDRNILAEVIRCGMLSSGSRVRVTPGAPKKFMKLIIKILIAILLILILLFTAAYIFAAIKGKALLTQKLEGALKREVNIGYLGLKFPLVLEIKDLNIAKFAKADYIYTTPSITGLLAGKIVLNKVKISKPEISWERTSTSGQKTRGNPSSIDTGRALAQTKETLNSLKTENNQPPPVVIKHLVIEDGIVNFTDRTVSEPGLRITLKEISLTVNNLYLFPKSAITNFQLNAKIPWQKDSEEGTIDSSGWMNFYERDMQARLQIQNIDGVYLHPYYSRWVDLENSRIQEARLNFFSVIKGENNDVIADCQLELTDIKFRPRPSDQPEHKAEKIATAVLGIFRAINQGRIILDFTIKTKMDKPEFKFESISSAVDKTISQAVQSEKIKIEDIAVLPGKFIEGVAKGTTGATKAIIEGALSVGKSLTDAFLDALKRPEEKPGETEIEQENP